MKKALMIVNPRAGKKRSHGPFFEAAAELSEAGYLLQIHRTTGRGDATRVAEELGPGVDLVVCAGGDGTLNETISGLMALEQKPLLGYLPAGSTNDFAASLHLSSDPVEAARTAAGGTPTPIDVGWHNGRYFSYVASFGAFTKASYSAPQAVKNKLGHLAYILQGIGSLDSLRPYRMTVEADGERFEGEFIFGGICNSTSLGGVMKLDPAQVEMNDGLFEMLLLEMPHSPADFQTLISALLKMRYDAPGVILRHVERVHITTRYDVPWSLDGEFAPSSPEVEIRNLRSAVRLML